MQFRTSKNRLTHYAFICGYIEVRDSEGCVETKLWYEPCCYHVRAHDFNKHVRVFWESFTTLSEARNFFNRQKGRLRRGRLSGREYDLQTYGKTTIPDKTQ